MTPSVTSTSERVWAALLTRNALPWRSPWTRSQRATPMFTASVTVSTTNAPASIVGSTALSENMRCNALRATS
jgi:hypothetical protein